jgi:hypothetical protein
MSKNHYDPFEIDYLGPYPKFQVSMGWPHGPLGVKDMMIRVWLISATKCCCHLALYCCAIHSMLITANITFYLFLNMSCSASKACEFNIQNFKFLE